MKRSRAYLMRAGWALALLCLPAAGPAMGAEDAGTVSLLSTGAGVRAVALGGAFTAVADDASGWMWNPAGLALVPRGEVQTANTSFAATGASEQYLGWVLPSWRWGALAASYRQLGVGGIEGRDSRNMIVPGELDARESELAFAYGVSLVTGWNAGLAARTRRQEVAGRSATSLGADLGLLVTPGAWLGEGNAWSSLQMGVSLRNAVSPSMRLDAESVPDPRALRLGAAMTRSLGGARSVLVSAELEQVDGLPADFHAGLECRLLSAFDARVGWGAGQLSAGSSFRVRGLSLDYAFTDTPLESQHRVGFSLPIGRSVNDSRLAAERRRSAEVEQRIASTLESRRLEQERSLRAEADSATASGDLVAATRALELLRAVGSDSPELRSRHARLLARRAAAAEQGGDPLSAAALYREAQAVDASDAVIRDEARRSEQRLLAARAGADSTSRLYRDALQAFVSGSHAEARAKLLQLRAVHPGDAGVSSLLRRVEESIAARSRELAAAAGEPKPAAVATPAPTIARPAADRARPSVERSPVLGANERAQVRRNFERATDLLRRGDRAEGMRWLEVVRAQDPSHAGARTLLVQEYQMRGLEAFSSGRLEQAVRELRRAIELDPNDARTRAYLERAQEHMSRTSANGGAR